MNVDKTVDRLAQVCVLTVDWHVISSGYQMRHQTRDASR